MPRAPSKLRGTDWNSGPRRAIWCGAGLFVETHDPPGVGMRDYLKFYIDGQWVDPIAAKTAEVINPATEAVSGTISLGSPADVDKAVAAARRAFATFGETSVK